MVFVSRFSTPLINLHLPKPLVLAAAFLSVTLASCVSNNQKGSSKATRVMYEWYDDQGPGKISLKIDLGDQNIKVMRGKREIGWAYVATGIEGRGTPAGSYRISEKVVDKYSNRYGWIENEFGEVVNKDASPGDSVGPGEYYMPAPMPYWMRLTDYGIGMHIGHIPQPGEPASHGCIRMPKEFVPTLFSMVDIGTQVKIRY